MTIFKYIYPCENCMSCVIDINSCEAYMCCVDGHHSGIIEGLSSNCPKNYKIKIIKEEGV